MDQDQNSQTPGKVVVFSGNYHAAYIAVNMQVVLVCTEKGLFTSCSATNMCIMCIASWFSPENGKHL